MTNEELLATVKDELSASEARAIVRENRLISDIAQMVERQTENFNLLIENNVTKRLNLMFEEYQFVHEKQDGLERKVEVLDHRLTDVEVKVG